MLRSAAALLLLLFCLQSAGARAPRSCPARNFRLPQHGLLGLHSLRAAPQITLTPRTGRCARARRRVVARRCSEGRPARATVPDADRLGVSDRRCTRRHPTGQDQRAPCAAHGKIRDRLCHGCIAHRPSALAPNAASRDVGVCSATERGCCSLRSTTIPVGKSLSTSTFSTRCTVSSAAATVPQRCVIQLICAIVT